ncbi:MAG: hypothetical protein IIB77_01285 [Proteobacteria bacterium]|nr:hypothetical protein [Pseudomonadota bacterium]
MPSENPFTAELSKRNPFAAELSRRESSGEAFIKTFGRETSNLLLGIPAVAGEALALGAAGAETVVAGFNPLIGIPGQVPDGPTFGERFQAQREKFPASALRAFRPTVQGITADIRSLPKLFPGGETFDESRKRLRDEFAATAEQRKERHPIAVGSGELAADVATLLSARAPAAKGINKLETKLFGKASDIQFGGAVPKLIAPGAKRLANNIIQSKAVKSLARGAGRSLEAGFEAATLDLLKGDDPLETAGWVMAGQAGGSVILTATKGLFSGGALRIGGKLALSALSFGAILQLVNDTVPGGEDSLIDSIEIGFEKVQLGLILGLIAGVAGGARFRGGRVAEDLPKIIDALAAIPRLSVISFVEDLVDAPPAERKNIERVISKLIEDPLFFGKDITPKLQNAMENNRFAEELRALQKDRKFKQKLFSIAPPDLTKDQDN